MTHKQIWTEIAEAFRTSENKGTEKQRDLARCGLCWAGSISGVKNAYDLCDLLPEGQIDWLPMRHRAKHRREYDTMRGDMAILLSCMTKKEFNQLVASD